MIVMITASTPSLNASSRSVFMRTVCPGRVQAAVGGTPERSCRWRDRQLPFRMLVNPHDRTLPEVVMRNDESLPCTTGTVDDAELSALNQAPLAFLANCGVR